MDTKKIDLSTLVGQPAAVLLEQAAKLPDLADAATARQLEDTEAALRAFPVKHHAMGTHFQNVTQDAADLLSEGDPDKPVRD